jgi:UDP-N-acetylmuramoyl-tripeptide--D-alanyl-D-alanine ligase
MCLAAFYPAKHALHMYQQNRYENGRYAGWIRENISESIVKNVLPVGLCLVSFILGFFHVPAIIFAVVCLLLFFYGYAMEKGTSYIKPLVVTARVKRQIAVMAVLGILCMVLILTAVPAAYCYGILSGCAWVLPWVLLFPVGWITSPIEHGVQKHYLNDAKHQLEEHTGLIKIGITGSYGKTTTKNIMTAMLSEKFNTLMTPASFNTPMGITRTIRENLKPIHQVFVCEMGADHVGDITELMEFVHPSIGVVTSIGPQHLNTFGSQENIIREKMQMIECLPADGFGILNYDNEFIRNYHIQNQVRVTTVGIDHEDVDYRAENITYTPRGSRFTVVHGDERIELETKLLGKLNILNILAAVAAARYLGLSWTAIAHAARSMKQVEHRLELKAINGRHFIDDAFNANPSGSRMALDVLGMMPGKRVIVTPGMIDLGEKQDEINHDFGVYMKDKADAVVLVGETQTKPIYKGLQDAGYDMSRVTVLATEKEAFGWVWQNTTAEDTILLENDLPDAFNH